MKITKGIIMAALALSLATPAFSGPCEEIDKSLKTVPAGTLVDAVTKFLDGKCENDTAYMAYEVKSGFITDSILEDTVIGADFQKRMKNQVCNTAAVLRMHRYGITPVYGYFTEDGKILAYFGCKPGQSI